MSQDAFYATDPYFGATIEVFTLSGEPTKLVSDRFTTRPEYSLQTGMATELAATDK